MANDWSVNDRRLLRWLRIEAGEPTPVSRFYVQPGSIDGEFDVIDREKKSRPHVFTPKAFKDVRAAAEDFARQMNERHAEQQR